MGVTITEPEGIGIRLPPHADPDRLGYQVTRFLLRLESTRIY